MPDWRQFVEEHLNARDLSNCERSDVVSELASHLEEVYDEQRTNGLPHSEAMHLASAEVMNWRILRRRIEWAKRQEGIMNHRTKSVWIPGLVTLTIASAFLAMLQVWGVRPHIVWTRSGAALMFYIPWLIAQPAFGAIGAYISRQNGGNWHERLTASVLPAAAMVAAFCVGFCVAIALGEITNEQVSTIGLVSYILLWAALPGLALALGALPFLGGGKLERAN